MSYTSCFFSTTICLTVNFFFLLLSVTFTSVLRSSTALFFVGHCYN
jgi:hypothetical protein